MFGIGARTRIFLACGATDMRKGFNGLYAMVQHQLKGEPLGGDLYIFSNRKRDCLKIFVYDGTGIWVCAKRLERGTFRWPRPSESSLEMNRAELQMLLSGIEFAGTKKRENWWSNPQKKYD